MRQPGSLQPAQRIPSSLRGDLWCARAHLQKKHRIKDVSVKRGIMIVGDSMIGRIKRATGMSESAALHGAVKVATVAPAHLN